MFNRVSHLYFHHVYNFSFYSVDNILYQPFRVDNLLHIPEKEEKVDSQNLYRWSFLTFLFFVLT